MLPRDRRLRSDRRAMGIAGLDRGGLLRLIGAQHNGG